MDVELWARSLAEHLQHHMDSEREVLTRYGRFAESLRDERVRYLVQLILDDEVRHHRTMAEMINWLRAETEWRPVAGPRMPTSTRGAEDEELLLETDRLLALEHEDASDLKELRRTVEEVEDTSWWTVIVEAMAHDTRKHIAILEHIRTYLEEHAR